MLVNEIWERYSKSYKESFIKGWNGEELSDPEKCIDVVRIIYRDGQNAKRNSNAQFELKLTDYIFSKRS